MENSYTSAASTSGSDDVTTAAFFLFLGLSNIVFVATVWDCVPLTLKLVYMDLRGQPCHRFPSTAALRLLAMPLYRNHSYLAKAAAETAVRSAPLRGIC